MPSLTFIRSLGSLPRGGPRRAARALRSPAILALDLVGAAPGRDPGGAAAAVTTAVIAGLRSCPDGAVRTLTRPVRAWFATPGP